MGAGYDCAAGVFYCALYAARGFLGEQRAIGHDQDCRYQQPTTNSRKTFKTHFLPPSNFCVSESDTSASIGFLGKVARSDVLQNVLQNS
jgi:hypothetical protein